MNEQNTRIISKATADEAMNVYREATDAHVAMLVQRNIVTTLTLSEWATAMAHCATFNLYECLIEVCNMEPDAAKEKTLETLRMQLEITNTMRAQIKAANAIAPRTAQ